MLLCGPQLPLVANNWKGPRWQNYLACWHQLPLDSGIGHSCGEPPSHMLALTLRPPCPTNGGQDPCPKATPALRAQPSRRMTPFFLLISIPRYSRPPPPSEPRQTMLPAQAGPLLPAQPAPHPVHTLAPPSSLAPGTCSLSGIRVRPSRAGGPPAPEPLPRLLGKPFQVI